MHFRMIRKEWVCKCVTGDDTVVGETQSKIKDEGASSCVRQKCRTHH